LVALETIIQQKQSGEILSNANIQFIVDGYTSGVISDDEMTTWLIAVFQNGMSHEETLEYTKVMLNSGITLDFSHLNGLVLDKHSTGGVGDKVSIILAPLLASCGLYIPMLAGRGLGHTQGTIDKLEAIPGYKTALSLTDFQQIVEKVGVSIMEQTEEICPADRKIYALRDVTNTVASFPLICGSIMSKKIAEGIQGLVLDIKMGNGAFMKTISEAKELGELLKTVGELYGLKVSICFTDMNQPLGNTAGLWCEVLESVECLKGNGPSDLMQVVYHLGQKALEIAGIENSEEKLKSNIKNGKAIKKFEEMIIAHGGETEMLGTPQLHKPKFRKEIFAKEDGFIGEMDTLQLGQAVVQLGGGRIHKNDKIDYSTGILFHKKIGEFIGKGEPLLEYFCSNSIKFKSGENLLKNIFTIQTQKPNIPPLFY